MKTLFASMLTATAMVLAVTINIFLLPLVFGCVLAAVLPNRAPLPPTKGLP